MQTASTVEPAGSSVRGVISEPVRVRDDATAARQWGATPTTGDTIKPAAAPGHRNAASVAPTKLQGVIRGDNDMVDAYPAAWHTATAAQSMAEPRQAHCARRPHNHVRR